MVLCVPTSEMLFCITRLFEWLFELLMPPTRLKQSSSNSPLSSGINKAFQPILCKLYRWLWGKVPKDLQLPKHSDQPVWLQQPCHIDLNHLSSQFRCSVWPLAGHLNHIYMPKCIKLLLPNKVAISVYPELQHSCSGIFNFTYYIFGVLKKAEFTVSCSQCLKCLKWPHLWERLDIPKHSADVVKCRHKNLLI